MKYLTDEEIKKMSFNDKINALDFIDFQKISEDVCENCNNRDNCEGYFSGSCVCSDEWNYIANSLLIAEQDMKRAQKDIEHYNEENPVGAEPLYIWDSNFRQAVNYG